MKPGEEKVWLDEFPATPCSVTPGATTPCLSDAGHGDGYTTGDGGDDGDSRSNYSNNNYHKDNGINGDGVGNELLQVRSPHRRSPLQVRFVDDTDAETQVDDYSPSQPILLQLPNSRTSTPVRKPNSPKL